MNPCSSTAANILLDLVERHPINRPRKSQFNVFTTEDTKVHVISRAELEEISKKYKVADGFDIQTVNARGSLSERAA
jgi:hypothetical protein